MTVDTKAFGKIEVSDRQKIHFEEGILGFDDIHYFFLIDYPDGSSPVYLLQSEEYREIAFVIIYTKIVIPDYQLIVDEKELSKIDLIDKNDILYFSIVTIYDNPENSTINLLGPLVINKKNRKAKQMISLCDQYSVRHPLISEGGRG